MDNWFLRVDNDGISHGNFVSAPVGEWTRCPKWGPDTKDDCVSGGLFGQGPGGFGFLHYGTRYVFAETEGPHISVGGNKIKVRAFKILYTGFHAIEEAINRCGGNWPGSLDLLGATLPEGFTTGDVGGSLDLRGATLPEGFTIGNVGGNLDLRDVITFPEGFTIGNVGGNLDLREATLPEGFTIGNVGGSLDLWRAALPKEFTIGDVGRNLDLHGATLPEGFTIGNVSGSLYLYGTTFPEGFVLPKVGGKVYR